MTLPLKLRNLSSKEEVSINRPSLLIGRSESCQVRITAGHPSREHARLVQKREGLFVQDLHSTNGTFVNNRRIEESTQVKVGDVLTFGEESFVLVSEDQSEMTIIAGRMTPKTNDDACILIADDDDDLESTQIRESFPLPQSWALGKQDAMFAGGRSQKEALRIIRQVASEQQRSFNAALVMYPDQHPPIVLGMAHDNLNEASWTIGRSANNDLPIDDPCISEHHATLRYKNNQWILEDNDSTNGIRVDTRLRKSIQLTDGLELSIGRVEGIFKLVRTL